MSSGRSVLARALARRSRPLLAVVASVAAIGLAAGCTGSNSISHQANSNGVTAGSVEHIAPADRHTVLTITGTTLTGAKLSTASYRGKVVVLNYWGSWCGPCQTETPDLKAAWTQLAPKGVVFLGLDSNESATTGLAYMKANGLGYPSLTWDGGQFLIQLKGKAPDPPTTIILDQQGRLAARVLSAVDTTTLVGLVDDVLAGTSA
jgi:thiol-disulfide isomerase/thioredoxin